MLLSVERHLDCEWDYEMRGVAGSGEKSKIG